MTSTVLEFYVVGGEWDSKERKEDKERQLEKERKRKKRAKKIWEELIDQKKENRFQSGLYVI